MAWIGTTVSGITSRWISVDVLSRGGREGGGERKNWLTTALIDKRRIDDNCFATSPSESSLISITPRTLIPWVAPTRCYERKPSLITDISGLCLESRYAESLRLTPQSRSIVSRASSTFSARRGSCGFVSHHALGMRRLEAGEVHAPLRFLRDVFFRSIDDLLHHQQVQ